LIKEPLVVSASSGYGLDYWVQLIGGLGSRTITSGFRDPVQNVACGGVPNGRHMFGDAVDLSATSPTDWQNMWNQAGNTANSSGAKASFREPPSGPCKKVCVHADWRKSDINKYVQ
jgi:hypothetical protein